MLWRLFFSACVLIFASLATASDLVVKRFPGKTSAETIQEIRRRLSHVVKRSGNTVLFDNSTTFSNSFDDKQLFFVELESKGQVGKNGKNGNVSVSSGIDVTCTKCYIKGKASAKVTASGPFNITKDLDRAEAGLEQTWDQITDYANNVSKTWSDDIANFVQGKMDDDVPLPPPDIHLNFDLDFPEYELEVGLRDLDLYVQLTTTLSEGVTYTFKIYVSETMFGIQLGKGLFLGAVFSIDLILSVESEIEISSGFHVAFDEVLTNIVLFDQEPSGLDFKGGKFEFLPITVQVGDTVLKALLRLELRIGFSASALGSPLTIHHGNETFNLGAAAGIEARVYANIVDLETNLTTTGDDQLDASKSGCDLQVGQGYTFGVGAAAGASLVLLGNSWGPQWNPATAIYYATTEVCAFTGTVVTTAAAAASGSPSPVKRQDALLRTTTVTKETYTATVCASTGVINCPASLLSLTTATATRTLTASVSSGATVVWSSASVSSFKTVDFQSHAITMTSSSGTPVSYVPPSTTATTGSSSSSSDVTLSGKTGGVSNKVIIGVSVGLGVPVVLAAVVGLLYFSRRLRRGTHAAVPTSPIEEETKGQSVITTAVPVISQHN